MTCQNLREALVDLARGVPVGPGTAGAVHSHVEHCPRCAARLARERELTASFRELAATAPSQAPAGAERRLLDAFEQRRARQEPLVAASATRRWVMAASVAALATGAAWLVWSGSSAPIEPAATSGTSVRRASDTHLAPEGVRQAVNTRARDSAAPERMVRRPKRSERGRGQAPAAPAPSVLAEFHPVPGAEGLPELESGRIVRVELPMAALATYGVEMVPDPARIEIEADLIIGQDGHPRAIRVVRSETESRSRR
jgi:sRNA-binding protein